MVQEPEKLYYSKSFWGLLRPDNGSIFVDGAEVDLDEPLPFRNKKEDRHVFPNGCLI